jgi:hypothetical protein
LKGISLKIYTKYGQIPEGCVPLLAKGLKCSPSACEALALKEKGGRPKNPWAEFAYEHSKLHLIEKGRLPTAKQLSKNVCKYALDNGFKESASGKEAFSVSTAKDYLGYFKNTSRFLEFLTAEQWFSIFEGNFATTKFFAENKFPP